MSQSRDQLESMTDAELQALCQNVSGIVQQRNRLAALPGSPLTDEYSEAALNCAESRLDASDVRLFARNLQDKLNRIELLGVQ